MNNKKIFSIRMFTQSFLQVKAFGIISTLVATFLLLLPKISDLAMLKRYYADGPMSIEMVNGIEANLALFITFIVITPILTFIIWNFLNKRNTSDFYHSLPYTRECLFISKFAVIIVWQIIYVFIPFLGSCIFYLVNSKYYSVSYKSMFIMAIVIFICNVTVAAACSLASAIGGNTFSNICVAGGIMFFPRVLLKTLFSIVADVTCVFSGDKVASILDDKYNMLFSMTINILDSYGADYAAFVYNAGSYIYTIIMTVLLIVLACIMFKIRKSETAGKAASGKVIPFVIKALLGFCFSVLGVCSAISTYYFTEMKLGFNVFYTLIILFIVAAVVVFVFEFIVSKRLRNVLICIPPIIVGYVGAIIVGAFVLMGINNILSYTPSADDIEYVTFSKKESMMYGEEQNEYFDKITSDIKIKDKQIKEIFAKALESNIDMVGKVHRGEQDYFGYSSKYKRYNVYFGDGGLGKYRTLYLTEEQVSKIAKILINVPEYKEAYTNLPEAEDVTVNFYELQGISKQDAKDIYKTYVDEVSKLKFEEWYMLVNMEGDSEATMYASFEQKGVTYNCPFKIVTKTPKTLAKFMEISNSTMRNNKSSIVNLVADKIINADSNDENYAYIEITDYSKNSMVAFENYQYKEIVEGSQISYNKVISDITSEVKNGSNAIDLNKPFMAVHSGVYDEKTGMWDSVTLYLQPSGYDDITDYIPESKIEMYRVER